MNNSPEKARMEEDKNKEHKNVQEEQIKPLADLKRKTEKKILRKKVQGVYFL